MRYLIVKNNSGAFISLVLLQQVRVLQQIFLELGEGSVAVADRVLHFLVQLCVCLVVACRFEHWIPTKVSGTTSGNDFALRSDRG